MGFAGYLFRQVFVHPPQLPSYLNLADQTILITGANSGIGLEAARQCVHYNASRLILAVRTLSKGEEAKANILSSNPTSKTIVHVWELDLESFDSVIAFGYQMRSLDRLDVAILNAGNFKFEWTTSATTGNESQLQVNHLSSALLSLLLVPVLYRTSRVVKSPSRLTFTSSEVHMWTPFKEQKAEKVIEELNKKELFGNAMDRYCVTKLLNVFWVRQLALQVDSGELVINYVNPGSVNTGLHRDGGNLIQFFDRVIGRTSTEGGRLLMDAAFVKGKDTHGLYLSEAKVVLCSAYVRSEDGEKMQKKLWSETMDILSRVVPDQELLRFL
ncbi:putative 3-oxoacyl-reductase [Xylogone sp. PMI_703]|nr:putative 3-oxoacyl-reductase [Xylogone sp. PMI_703]